MEISGLLVKVRGDAASAKAGFANAVGADSMEPILTIPANAAAAGSHGFGASTGSMWFRIGRGDEANPWDAAHRLLLRKGSAFAANGAAGIEVVEPDIEQDWLRAPTEPGGDMGLAKACTFHQQDGAGGKAVSPSGNAWNIQGAYSQLQQARGQVSAEELRQVVVAHLDTGYDPDHATRPLFLDLERQRNFRDKDRPKDASDQTPDGLAIVRNQGHGTATLALLAGNKLDGSAPSWPDFRDFIGGAPGVTVIPIRIADWVVRFSTSTMVQGFQHAIDMEANVLCRCSRTLDCKESRDAAQVQPTVDACRSCTASSVQLGQQVNRQDGRRRDLREDWSRRHAS